MSKLEDNRLVPVGKIVKAHGVHGRLRVAYYNEDKTNFFSYHKVWLKSGDDRLQSYQIKDARVHRQYILVQFEGTESLDQAEPLVGATVLVERTALPTLEEGEYYWIDLLGMEVITTAGDRLGEVSQVIPTGGTDVFVVRRDEGEILIPAHEEIIRQVDVASRRMIVSLREDLVDDNSI